LPKNRVAYRILHIYGEICILSDDEGGNVKWHRTTEGRKVATRGTFAATVPIGQPKIMMLAIPNHHPESCATNAKVKRPQAIAPKCR
jgi:hypothetical protein